MSAYDHLDDGDGPCPEVGPTELVLLCLIFGGALAGVLWSLAHVALMMAEDL